MGSERPMPSPLKTESSSLPVIGYRDPLLDRWQGRTKFLQYLACLLSIFALAIAAFIGWLGLKTICGIALITALPLLLDAWKIRKIAPRQLPWAAAILLFGLCTLVMLYNQFHGLPPPSDRYVIAGCVVSFVLSVVGLVIECR